MTRAFLLACSLILAGCAAGASSPEAPVPVVWLYRLDRVPTAEDWRALPPTEVTARGGAMVDPGLAYRMDQSLTHQANADCHHGPGAGATIRVAVSGFWSPDGVWLRVAWEDRTANDSFRAWRRSPGGGWVPTGEREDGVSVAWGAEGFPCHQACHLADWEFSQGNWVPRYAMVSKTDPVPFWVWRAFRGGVYRQAETGYLGPDRVNYSPGGPRFALNSTAGPDDPLAAFTEGDRPAAAAPGETLPGVLGLGAASRGGVTTTSRRTGKSWEVTMHRSLTVGVNEGISLEPARGAVIGIALFDDSLTDHHIVQEPLRLAFLPAAKEVAP